MSQTNKKMIEFYKEQIATLENELAIKRKLLKQAEDQEQNEELDELVENNPEVFEN